MTQHSSTTEQRPYHHGDLHSAIVGAALAVLTLNDAATDAKGKFGLDPGLHLAGDFRSRLILGLGSRNDADHLRRLRHLSLVFAGSQNRAGETNSEQSKGLHFLLQ